MSKCKSCGAEIIWAKTPTGKSMPLDAEPHPRGNIVLDANGCTGPVRPGDVPDLSVRYLSHFVTCPEANQHRKSK
jgi:hypothetical protein